MTEPADPAKPLAEPPKQTEVSKIPEVLDALPREAKNELLETLLVAKSHQGPLPDPDTLEHYGRIIPNAPAILLNEVVQQSRHRQDMEKTIVGGNVRFASTGQWMAFVLVIFLSLLATYLAMQGHTTLAGIVFVTTIGAVLSAFVLGKLQKEQQAPKPSPPAPTQQQMKAAKTNKRR